MNLQLVHQPDLISLELGHENSIKHTEIRGRIKISRAVSASPVSSPFYLGRGHSFYQLLQIHHAMILIWNQIQTIELTEIRQSILSLNCINQQ